MPIHTKRVQFDLTDGEMKPRFVDGQELPNWKDGPTMIDYIHSLHEEGWRLTVGAGGQEYVFERHVP